MNAGAGALLLIGLFLVSLLAVFLWVQWRREAARRVETEIALSVMRRERDAATREAERLSEVFGVALDAFPRPVLVTSSRRQILYANPAALTLLDMSAERVLGQLAARVMHDYESTQMLIDAARLNEPQEQIVQRTGSGQTWRIAVTPHAALAPIMACRRPSRGARRGLSLPHHRRPDRDGRLEPCARISSPTSRMSYGRRWPPYA